MGQLRSECNSAQGLWCGRNLRGEGLAFAISTATLTALALVLGGCAGPPAPHSGFRAADLACVDDSSRCLLARQRALKHLLADEQRTWVAGQPSAEHYAAGVRLFAYKKTKSKLSCQHLKHGAAEAKAAKTVLRGRAGQSLTPAQVSRGVILGSETARELRREIRKRCK